MSDQDDWDKQMERLDERTGKRRAKSQELEEEMRKAIREVEERRDAKESADQSEGPEGWPRPLQLAASGQTAPDERFIPSVPRVSPQSVRPLASPRSGPWDCFASGPRRGVDRAPGSRRSLCGFR